MSNRTRIYLNLKDSILKLFRTDAYYLKEMTRKWSTFEKPYLDQDYRAMHLKMNRPTWGTWRFEDFGLWPSEQFKWWAFQWGPGTCWVGSMNAVCGQTFDVSVMISLPPPSEDGAGINVSATSSASEVKLIGVLAGMDNFSAILRFKVDEGFTGTTTICVKATLQGEMLKSYVVKLPMAFQGNLRLEDAFKMKPLTQDNYSGGFFTVQNKDRTPIPHASGDKEGASIPPAFKEVHVGEGWDCGCQDVVVECFNCQENMAWDEAGSADTVARGAACTVAITDDYDDPGPTGWAWSVSGTGFSLANAQTFVKTNVLSASAIACGTATITVTKCGGQTVRGYVRCTTGSWVTHAEITTCPWSFVGASSPWTYGKWQVYQAKRPYCISSGGGCTTPALCIGVASPCKPGGNSSCGGPYATQGCNHVGCDYGGTMHCTPCAQPLGGTLYGPGVVDCGCAQRTCAAGQQNCVLLVEMFNSWVVKMWEC